MPRLLIAATVATTIRAFLLPFARHYRELGWRVDAAASGAAESDACRANFDHVWDIGWSRNPADVPGVLSGLKKVRELVLSGDYDIVHVHTPVAGFVVRAALRNRGLRTKVVYTAHGFHFQGGASPLRNAVFVALERLAGQWTDALITINQEDYAAAHGGHIVSPDRLHYMPGIGIDIAQFSRQAVDDGKISQLRREIGVCDSRGVFLQVAEFIPRKRHADVLRALASLGDSSTLLLAGTGPLLPAMRQLSAKLGVANRVRFLGQRDDVPALMRLADVVLLPSQREGLPRCVMEAMAMGKPVIGSDIRGTRDLLIDGGGLLVPAGDAGALARAMEKLAAEPQTRIALGKAGRKAVAQYDIQRILECHDELYGELLQADSTSRHAANAVECYR